MTSTLGRVFETLASVLHPCHKWAERTLVVGPFEPVDGDSVACTKALITHLRKRGLEAFTLPTIAMFDQIAWILDEHDFHSRSLSSTHLLLTDNLQAAYDNMLVDWKPDEIIVVDGQADRLGFDPRGVKVYTIDHHLHHGKCDNKTGYIQPGPSAGCLLIEHYLIREPILAVSILTDTFWFRQSMPCEAIKNMAVLTEHGLTDELLIDYQKRLIVKKDPETLLAIQRADLKLSASRKTVFVVMRERKKETHRDIMAQLGYYFYNFCVVRADGYTSFRAHFESDQLDEFAKNHGGSGHQSFGAFPLSDMSSASLDNVFAEFIAIVEPNHRG